eukprot:scaffold1936_cov154-Amphora_coffeaeformis.AAC.11
MSGAVPKKNDMQGAKQNQLTPLIKAAGLKWSKKPLRSSPRRRIPKSSRCSLLMSAALHASIAWMLWLLLVCRGVNHREEPTGALPGRPAGLFRPVWVKAERRSIISSFFVTAWVAQTKFALPLSFFSASLPHATVQRGQHGVAVVSSSLLSRHGILRPEFPNNEGAHNAL